LRQSLLYGCSFAPRSAVFHSAWFLSFNGA
jgi:hypothetical protein